MSELLARYAAEAIEFEEFAGFDAKSRPTYNTPQLVTGCRVVEEVRVRVVGDGTHERTTLTVWLPADAEYVPTRDDRFAWGPDFKYHVVREVEKPKRLDGTVHHVRLLCREA